MDTTAYGDRVRAARVLRGWKSVDLAEELGWPPSRQTTVEQSETVRLASHVLDLLVEKLDFPEKFFTTRPAPPLGPRELLFRAPVATTKREKTYLSEFARAVGELLAWLDTYHRLPPVKLPALPADTPAAEAAQCTREALGLARDQPIVNLTHRLERAGLPIIVRNLASRDELAQPSSSKISSTENHLGYSARVGEHGERPISVLRGHESWERMRWTTAHEAGHVVLHGSALPGNAEDQASAFASELLAPADCLCLELPRHITLTALTELKMRWGISLGALILHLSANDLISAERKRTLQRQLYTRVNPETGRSWGRDEPGRHARVVELPSLIGTWMQRCLGGTAPNLVATLSGIWPADIIAQVLTGQRVQQPAPNRKAQMITRSKGRRQSAGESHADVGVIDLQAWRLRA